MATDQEKLYAAFDEEAKTIDVQDLMAQMMESVNAEKGYEPNPIDELKIRKMMLARKFIEKEANRLAMLRDAIKAEWDEKVKRKLDEVNGINEFIEMWIKKYNKGQKLSLDVGTATLRRSAPKVKVNDVVKAKAFLEQHKQLASYQKAPELDTTLLQNAYINQFNKLVEEEAKKVIEEEIKSSKNGKITQKREKEIKLAKEQELADSYYQKLPDFFDYIPEAQNLSITMK